MSDPSDDNLKIYGASDMFQALDRGRLEGLKAARQAALRAHRNPVGASDGGTYVSGTNVDAVNAIQKLIDEASK